MNNQGTCPRCKGSKRIPATEARKAIVAGYNPVDDTFPCTNCGGQYQDGTGPTGLVPLRPDSTPCLHQYQEVSTPYQRIRGHHHYLCALCSDAHYINSSD